MTQEHKAFRQLENAAPPSNSDETEAGLNPFAIHDVYYSLKADGEKEFVFPVNQIKAPQKNAGMKQALH